MMNLMMYYGSIKSLIGTQSKYVDAVLFTVCMGFAAQEKTSFALLTPDMLKSFGNQITNTTILSNLSILENSMYSGVQRAITTAFTGKYTPPASAKIATQVKEIYKTILVILASLIKSNLVSITGNGTHIIRHMVQYTAKPKLDATKSKEHLKIVKQ